MKKFLLVSPKNRTAYNFRGDLIRDIRAKCLRSIETISTESKHWVPDLSRFR